MEYSSLLLFLIFFSRFVKLILTYSLFFYPLSEVFILSMVYILLGKICVVETVGSCVIWPSVILPLEIYSDYSNKV